MIEKKHLRQHSLRVLLLALALGFSASGCTWARIVVNERVKTLDPSFIVEGQTTWREVLRRLGPPTSQPSDRSLIYSSSDQRVTEFGGGLFLWLPFHWSDQQQVYALLVEFDDNGVVTGVYRTERGTIRPPFQGERKRRPATTTRIEGGNSS